MRSAILLGWIVVAAVAVCQAQNDQPKDVAQPSAPRQSNGASAASEKSQNAGSAANAAVSLQTGPAKLGAAAASPAAIGTPAPVDVKTYVIGPEDVIGIKVWDDAQLSGAYVVRPDGRISLPLIHDVVASGLTPEQLEKSIAQSLSNVMVMPEVAVSVQQVNSKRYYVQGEVLKPGAYSLAVPLTVMEALVNAGGFRDFANTKKIVILRGNEKLTFNYKDVSNGKHMEQNIRVEPGDQIIVH